MAWEFRYEIDQHPCGVCACAVLIESERESSAPGLWGPWTPRKAWCTRCCVVVSDAEERICHPNPRKRTMPEHVKETVPCPRQGCGGIALAEIKYSDTGGGTLRERAVQWILDCRTCGYWGPNTAT